MPIPPARPSHVCWLDLAASDAPLARAFYSALFAWRAREARIGNGRYTCLAVGETDVASLYQLHPRHLANGVPSHWTPYVAVTNVDDAASRADALGARVIVAPHDTASGARIGLIQDPVGALMGLWQSSK